MKNFIKNVTKNPSSLTTALFLSFILIFGLLTMGKVGFSYALSIKNRLFPQEISAATNTVTPVSNNTTEESNALKKLLALGKRGIASVENRMSTYAFLQPLFIELNGGFRLVLGQQIVYDADPDLTVVKEKHNFLTYTYQNEDVSDYSANFKKLKTVLDKKEIGLLYVQAPFKLLKNYSELPAGITDSSNFAADQFLESLEENQINYLDLREEIIKDQLNPETIFFKTDHHWKTESIFWGFKKISDVLREDYAFNISNELTDINQYTVKNFEKTYIGSQGKRTGVLYSGIDDYALITPNFETELEATKKEMNGSTKTNVGSFKAVLTDDSLLKKDVSRYTDHYTTSYFEGFEKIIKNKINDNPKILLISDSFGRPMTSFLSLVTSEIRQLDYQSYNTKSVYEYVNEYEPDLVIFLYNPSVLSGNKEKLQQLFTFDRIIKQR